MSGFAFFLGHARSSAVEVRTETDPQTACSQGRIMPNGNSNAESRRPRHAAGHRCPGSGGEKTQAPRGWGSTGTHHHSAMLAGVGLSAGAPAHA